MYVPTRTKLVKISVPIVLVTLITMLLWSNMHMFFPLGIIFISMLVLARFLEIHFIDKGDRFDYYYFLVPIVAVLPTLINPWGIHLWSYVDRLRTHASSDWVTEMAPIQFANLSEPLTLSFYLLMIVYLLLYFYGGNWSLRKLGIVSPLLLLSGAAMSLKHCKLVPATALFIFAACLELLSRPSAFIHSADKAIDNSEVKPVVWQEINAYLEQIFYNKSACVGCVLLLVIMGALNYARANSLTLPNTSAPVSPPFQAIEFLKTHRPMGKLFNDPYFGSIMTWYLNDPELFYDTRFAQYPPERMLESLRIKTCNTGWQEDWRKYNFDWVFIPPSLPLAKALRSAGWKAIYEDKTAIILTK